MTGTLKMPTSSVEEEKIGNRTWLRLVSFFFMFYSLPVVELWTNYSVTQ